MLSHRRSVNFPLLIVFSANYVNQFNCDLHSTTWYFESFDFLIWVDYMQEMTRKLNNRNVTIERLSSSSKYCTAFEICRSDWLKSWCIMQIQSSFKVHLNMVSSGGLSDPICDSINRGLTLFSQIAKGGFIYISLNEAKNNIPSNIS